MAIGPQEKDYKLKAAGCAITSHFTKYAKLVPALSLLFALIDTPNSQGVIDRAGTPQGHCLE